MYGIQIKQIFSVSSVSFNIKLQIMSVDLHCFLFYLDTGSDTSLRKEVPMMDVQAHHDSEVVVPKEYSLYDSHDKPLTRKIASGPQAPHYKGNSLFYFYVYL